MRAVDRSAAGMVRRWGVAALLGCTLAVAAWPAPSSGAPRSCDRPGDRPLSGGDRVRVIVNADGRTLACNRLTGRRLRLESRARRSELVALNHVWVAGPFVLFEVFGADETKDDVSLRLRDVRRGDNDGGVNLAGTTATIGPDGLVLDGVVDADGNVAAILDSSDIGGPSFAARRVIVCPYRGCGDGGGTQPIVVDRGSRIRGASLVRRGRSVTWISNGKRRRTLLRAAGGGP